jgi:hypothetical protein
MDVYIWEVKDYICKVIFDIIFIVFLIENIRFNPYRYLFNLKKKVKKNKVHVEISICEACIF